MRQYWQQCDRNGCKKYHARSLHGCTTPGLTLCVVGSNSHVRSPKNTGDSGSAILVIEDIMLPSGNYAKVFWDNGSTIALVIIIIIRLTCQFHLKWVAQLLCLF